MVEKPIDLPHEFKEQEVAGRQSLEAEVRLGERLQGLLKSAGWEDLQNELLNRMDTCANLLANSKDEIDIYRSQGAMREIKAILFYPEQKVDDGKEASLELERGDAGITEEMMS